MSTKDVTILQCPNFPAIGCAQSVLTWDSLGREQRHASHKRCASQRTGPVTLLVLSFTVAKKLAQKSSEPSSEDTGTCDVTNHRQQMLAHVMLRLCLSTVTSRTWLWFYLDDIVVSKVITNRATVITVKLCNWHADSSRRSILQLSRERTAPRISSWTSLKHHIHF